MSFCPKCGSHMDPEDRFCQHCGFNVVRTGPAVEEDDKTVMAPSKRPDSAAAAKPRTETSTAQDPPGARTGGGGAEPPPPFTGRSGATQGDFASGPRVEPQPAFSPESAGLLGRIKGILVSPKSEWPVIAAEPPAPAALMTSYVLPLAAIGPIAQFIGLVMIGVGVPFVGTIRIGVLPGLGMMVTTYVLGLAAVFLMAWIANALAPTFSGVK
ncbi:MAG: zinc-ribbon domain-containing protein, partial [Rhodocyclaceae bacterium]